MSCLPWRLFLWIFCCSIVFGEQSSFQNKIITSVRHGLDLSLNYIDENHTKMNADCFLGVVFATVLLEDAFCKGKHVMDKSTLRLHAKAQNILQKYNKFTKPSESLLAKYLVDPNIWKKRMIYKSDTLDKSLVLYPNISVIYGILEEDNEAFGFPTTNYCFEEIFNASQNHKNMNNQTSCYIDKNCWEKYFVDSKSHGYFLTHKFMMWQLSKATGCVNDTTSYEIVVKKYCSLILLEVYNIEHFYKQDDFFDLLLEEIFLCGYEGRTEFLMNKWLYYIIKSQHPTGCYPAILSDRLKTRIKRTPNIYHRKKRESNTLEDGCSDHTTGLGAAVLALFYNYIIKENIANLEKRFISFA